MVGCLMIKEFDLSYKLLPWHMINLATMCSHYANVGVTGTTKAFF